MHGYVDNGRMDGFTNGYQMAYYDNTDLPFYYWFVKTFTLADHYFPSVLSGTTPNRLYLQYASSGGAMSTGDSHVTMPALNDRLTAKGLSTASYGPSSFASFQTALTNGSLASVVWLNSNANTTDEHPPANVQEGEAWTRQLFTAIVASPLWSSTAFIWTYDEGGGFFDHVVPPHSCPPNDGTPNQAMFFELGIRVPMVIASPWARPHYVSHVVHEHTSITRFIETVFDLPALTQRDANSDALLDMFDFSCPNMAPVPTPPAAGAGGCH
jgi:phospholipase C